MAQDKSKTCSFCGKRQHDVSRLIAGPKVNICDECIQLCNGLLVPEDEKVETSVAQDLVVPKPHELMAALDEHVVVCLSFLVPEFKSMVKCVHEMYVLCAYCACCPEANVFLLSDSFV